MSPPVTKLSLALTIALHCISSSDAHAAVSQPRNDTGQTYCSDTEGQVIACNDQSLPGQDGMFGRDPAAANGVIPKIGGGEASFDFTKIANNGNEVDASTVQGPAPDEWACTRDNRTGHLWEIKTWDGGPRHAEWAFSWYSEDPMNGGNPGLEQDYALMCNFTIECNTKAYVNYINTINLCGRSDWRLPTLDELQNIAHFGRSDWRALDAVYFENPLGVPSNYATDSTMEPGPHHVWTVNMADGHSESAPKDGGSATPRLVAGDRFATSGPDPQCGESNSLIESTTAGAFTADPIGTAVDARTGLTWWRCAIGAKPRAEGQNFFCEGEGEAMPWEMALQKVREQNEQQRFGYSDWRLPNIKELASIHERRCKMPALDSTVFPGSYIHMFLSSTSYALDEQNRLAWGMQYEMGLNSRVEKHQPGYVLLVRGGDDFADYAGGQSYRIGGTLKGMIGSGLRLHLGSSVNDDLTLDANGKFFFAAGIADQSNYSVTIDQGPTPMQNCQISNDNGQVNGADVSDIVVSCDPPASAQIEVSPGSLSYSLGTGSSAEQNLIIRNIGGGFLDWSAQSAFSRPAVATIIGVRNASECRSGGALLRNDDGSNESAIGGQQNWNDGLIITERFTPASYPASITTACLPLGAQVTRNLNFEVVVFADNGPNGGPGNELGKISASLSDLPTYPATEPSWYAFDISSINTTVHAGNLYVGLRGLPGSGNAFVLADMSEDRPVGYSGAYWKRNGTWNEMANVPGFEAFRSTMIRAVQGAAQTPALGCANPGALTWLSLSSYAGSVAENTSSTVTAIVNSYGLPGGTYNANICVDSNASNTALVTIPVQLNVSPTVSVTPIVGAGGSIKQPGVSLHSVGQARSLQVRPNTGYFLESIGGSCSGTLNELNFVTSALSSSCTVEIKFGADTIFRHGFDS